MKALKLVGVMSLGVLLVLSLSGRVGRTEEPKVTIEGLAWIAGSWEMISGDRRTEEHWTDVAGGTLFGVSRTVAGGKTVFFEYLRIEERSDGIYYVAYPKGQAETDFKLVRHKGQEAVFENLAHDFPQRIIYRKNPDGSLLARIEGPQQGKLVGEDFPFQPMKKK